MRELVRLLLLFILVSTPHLASATLAELDSPTMNGTQFRLMEHRGKVVLVDFWATWCPPCRQSLKHYASLQERYGDKGLVVVAISSEEDAEAIALFVQEMGLSFPIIHDAEGAIAARFNPTTMPTAFLINKQGAIEATYEGFNPGDERIIERKIASLLGETTPSPLPLNQALSDPISAQNSRQGYRQWSYGLWSTGAVLLGASAYLYLGPLQDSIETRDTNYQKWQNTRPSPQFEAFEQAFLEAEGRAEKQEIWTWALAGAGITTVLAGFITWFSQPKGVASEATTMLSELRVNLMPRWNSHTPGFDLLLTW